MCRIHFEIFLFLTILGHIFSTIGSMISMIIHAVSQDPYKNCWIYHNIIFCVICQYRCPCAQELVQSNLLYHERAIHESLKVPFVDLLFTKLLSCFINYEIAIDESLKVPFADLLNFVSCFINCDLEVVDTVMNISIYLNKIMLNHTDPSMLPCSSALFRFSNMRRVPMLFIIFMDI